MRDTISITGISALSALGHSDNESLSAYSNQQHYITSKDLGGTTFVSALSEASQQEIARLRKSNEKYKHLDNSVLYALLVSRKAI